MNALVAVGASLLIGIAARAEETLPEADAVWRLVREATAIYEQLDEVDYDIEFQSPEVEREIAARTLGIPLKPELRMVRRDRQSRFKIAVPALPEPFRSIAEEKIDQKLSNIDVASVVQSTGWNLFSSFLRMLDSGQQYDVIGWNEAAAVLEFNDLSEAFLARVVRSARFSFDRRRGLISAIELWLGGDAAMGMKISYAAEGLIPGTHVPPLVSIEICQKGFNGPPSMSAVFKSSTYTRATGAAKADELDVWKRKLVNAGISRFVAERTIKEADAMARIDLSGTLTSDLTMLAGLPVKSLNLARTGVSDLTPLRGLPLERLVLDETPVTDLGPLEGMKLNTLSLVGVRVRSLAALAGMPLVVLDLANTPLDGDLTVLAGSRMESLNIQGLPVSDLTPLRSLPMRELNAMGSAIRDLSPLADAPLRVLLIGGSKVSDLAPLAGAPLEILNIEGLPVPDLTPIRGASLHELTASRSQLADLTALAGAPLRTVRIDGTKIRDLSPLRGAPLEELSVGGCDAVTSLAGLSTAALRSLSIDGTAVRDLSPLGGAPLERLSLRSTPVRDLSPLGGMPLKELQLDGCAVPDLSALAGMPLEELSIGKKQLDPAEQLANRPTDLNPLRGLPLKRLSLEAAQSPDVTPLAKCLELTHLVLPKDARNVEALRALPKLQAIGWDASGGWGQVTAAGAFWKDHDERKGHAGP